MIGFRLLLAVLVLFPFLALGTAPLFDLDEGAFTASTMEMFLRGDFLSSHLLGEPRYDKPILIYWLQAASVSLLGSSEFSWRLPSALASSLWILATHGFVARVRDQRTGLAAALKQNGLAFEYQPGEGAFYGPKIEFTLKDTLGRLWQVGTIQLDFNLPVRLGAEFVDEDNTRKPPVMLHRAILGSLERFIGILIEHYAGNFPVWLAPVQVVVMDITDAQAEYAAQIVQDLKKQGIRAVSDLRNEKITYKIREHSMQRVPYLIIVGEKERQEGRVAVRKRGGEDLGAMDLDAFLGILHSGS